MKDRQSVLLVAVSALAVWLTACGGSGSSSNNNPPTPPAITVAFSATPGSSLAAGATMSMTAVVSNDSAGKGVTWSVTCGSSGACGTFNPTSTGSGTATTYTAPAAVPTNNTVTVTATSVADTTKAASATITITAPPPPALSVAINPAAPSSLVTGTTTSLTAVVTNDSASKGVTWTVTCGSSGACGSFSPASTASGSPTTYTAPAAIPTNNTVTVTATSVSDTTKSATATITITAPAAILANGTYVYHFSGYDDNGPAFFAGAFTVASGAITGGEQDFVNSKTGYSNAINASGSGLSNAGGNIQIVLSINNTNLGVNGVETLRGTVVSSSRVLISDFDGFAFATGSLDLQTSNATPSGGYAFVVSGWDLSTPIAPLVVGGILNFSGGTLQTGTSVFDFNDGGVVGQGNTFSSGSVTAPDSYGRVTFSLTPSANPSFVLTGYVVGTNQIQLVESQTDTLSDDLGGMALGQASNAQFSQSTISGTTYVYGVSGQDTNGLTTIGGGFNFSSSGTVSGSLVLNDTTNHVVSTITGGTYKVDPTGRVTLSNVLSSSFSNAQFTFQLYLDGNGNALELGADNLQATSGPAYHQTATSADFEGSYALVGQGFLNAQNQPAWGAVGPVTVSSDNFNGFTDYAAQGINPTPNQSLTGTENNSAGTLSLTGINAVNFTGATTYNYYPIDSKRVLAIESDGNQLGLLTLETVSH